MLFGLKLFQQEAADALHGQIGLTGGEHLEHVPHVVPHLQAAGHLGGVHPVPEADGVGEEQLVAAGLNQGGREAGKVPEEGGEEGVGQVVLPGVGGPGRP